MVSGVGSEGDEDEAGLEHEAVSLNNGAGHTSLEIAFTWTSAGTEEKLLLATLRLLSVRLSQLAILWKMV